MKINLQPASLIVLALTIMSSLLIVGCGSGENPNYSTEIKKSDADKEREAANMAGQKPPGNAPGASGGPGTLTVPGKGGH